MPGNHIMKFHELPCTAPCRIYLVHLHASGMPKPQVQYSLRLKKSSCRISFKNTCAAILRSLLNRLNDFREREKQDQQNQTRRALTLLEEQVLNDPDSPIAGNPEGDVTVVEFFDYHCTYCKRIIPIIQKLLKQDKNVRYVFKELPILSPASRLAARAALVVWKYQKENTLIFMRH